ncbi:phage integrase SAM-like domain-containing protein [Pedobacter sp. Leaf132]|uniref:tyrosine-type recombinase/integrase n=1 Tax=Pedobacter sp. Leaf132 TaxID=2876557 RepID=UPI001E4228EA|nr:phage integrase SAM-like domain-containing protein [Pedobacter sp. Leaf132]
MSTFKALVFEHHKKQDNTWNVKIRLTHKRVIRYLDTPIFIVKSQMNRKFEIKDDYVLELTNEIVKNYREAVASLKMEIFSMTADEVKSFLEKKFETKQSENDSKVDFIQFARTHIAKIKKAGRDSKAMTYNAIVNSIEDYFKKSSVDISEINYKFLIGWESFLKSERTMERKNQHGVMKEITKRAATDSGVYHYMKDLRTLFNEAIRMYNDEDTGEIQIKHYPFRKYKIGNAPKTKKRNLTKDEINSIINLDLEGLKKGSLLEMGRDVGLLCFYLIGMNTTDIFHINKIQDGRISYNRRKTRGERADDAYISIKVEPEAEELIKKYMDENGERVFSFHRRYVDERSFNKAVNEGLKQVANKANIDKDLTSVFLRHSWATIARNKCDIDKDIIGKALNHVDAIGTITDVYIETDWSIIDDANRKVLNYLKDE